MSFWELIGLASKRDVKKLQDDMSEIKLQLNELLKLTAKDEALASLNHKVEMIGQETAVVREELNKETQAVQENVNGLIAQVENMKNSLKDEIINHQEVMEVLLTKIKDKLVRSNTKNTKKIESEMEDIGILLKALAMQGISEEIEQMDNQ